MREWRLLELGPKPPYFIHAIYEAVARSVSRGESPPTLILVHPSEPYVCVGFHQIPSEEVDLARCAQDNVLVLRRQIGGGTVYLDEWQQFYHVVTHHEAEPLQMYFQKYLRPVVEVYRSYGLDANYKALNDITVHGRKISGNGAARIMDSMVLVGNVILDIDPEAMTRYLKVPSEKFRDKMARSTTEWITSLRRETGTLPRREEVRDTIAGCFERTLRLNLVASELYDDEVKMMRQIEGRLRSREWLEAWEDEHRSLVQTRRIKVKAGIEIVEANYKGDKHIKVLAEVEQGRIKDIMFTGDFFMVSDPDDLRLLEEGLKGIEIDEGEIGRVVERFYKGNRLEGLTSEEVVNVVLALGGNPET